MLPATATRVQENTRKDINERIRFQTERDIAYFVSSPEEIENRLKVLDREWDIERTLETNASALGLLGILFGIVFHWAWLFVPVVALVFLLGHALQGWCPLVPLFRRLGVRTTSEIDAERYALKLIRGDFGRLSKGNKSCSQEASEALSAVERGPGE